MFKSYVKDAGYVNPEDVRIVTDTYASILDIQFEDIRQGDYVWVGKSWLNLNVHKYTNTPNQLQV